MIKVSQFFVVIVITLFTLSVYSADYSSQKSGRDPFSISDSLLDLLTSSNSSEPIESDIRKVIPSNLTLINGLPHIQLQAVSFGKNKRTALLKKKDESSLLVAEGDRLYLIEQGEYIEMKILEIKPRSIRIQLGPHGQIVEVQ